MKQEKQERFVRMPTPWVWVIFLLSMTILTASMLTLREGLRFVSRPLSSEERDVVAASLELWGKAGLEGSQDGPTLEKLQGMLKEKRIRAMDRLSFLRAQERSTFGYTDERGRILLNPGLCFTYQRALGPHMGGPIQSADVVATLATLYHESRHLVAHAPEAVAYEEEWLFVRRLTAWAERGPQAELLDELRYWDSQMAGRVEIYVGKPDCQHICDRVQASLDHQVSGTRP